MKRPSLMSRLAALHAILGVLAVLVAVALFIHLHTIYIQQAIELFQQGDRASREAAHWRLLAGYLVFIVGGIAALHWLMRVQLRPLQWLRAGVDAVARGDFKTRVPVAHRDEIGQVAEAFNAMTRQVEEMIADRERLLGDVSHELRSPLARIKVALALLPEGEHREAIENDVRGMETLIAVLLERERVRARAEQMTAGHVDLAALIGEVVKTFAGREPGVEFPAAVGDFTVAGDEDLLRLLVSNLLENAVKFSRADSRPVEVRLRRSGEDVVLQVSDDGPGIPEGERERIFEPFVKLDPARGHRRGYGLGLNLCRRIVEAHGGTIRFASKADNGAVAEVTLTPVDGGARGARRPRRES